MTIIHRHQLIHPFPSSLANKTYIPQAPGSEPREEPGQEAQVPRKQASALGQERGAWRRRRWCCFDVVIRATVNVDVDLLDLNLDDSSPPPLAPRLRAALRRHRAAPAPRRALQRLRRGPPAGVLRRRGRRGQGGGSSSSWSCGRGICDDDDRDLDLDLGDDETEKEETTRRHPDPPRPGDPRGALPPRRRRRARGRARVPGARAEYTGQNSAGEKP